MMSDDDDNISVTSTTASEQLGEYEVETILTEGVFDNEVKYLVKWADYPIERSTWEPEDSFFNQDTFLDWEKKKKAIEQGKRWEFDLASFYEHLDRLDEARRKRKRRREAKRKGLGLTKQQTDDLKKKRVDDANRSASQFFRRTPATVASSATASSTLPTPAQFSGSEVARPTPAIGPGLRYNKVPPKPPMVMFGSSEGRQGPWMAMRNKNKRPGESDGQPKAFNNLSTKWRMEKAKGYEPPPNINQLELVRPSDWPPRGASNNIPIGNNASSPKIGNHPVNSPTTNLPLPSSTTRTNPLLDNDRVGPPRPKVPKSGAGTDRLPDSWSQSRLSRELLGHNGRNSGDSWRRERPISRNASISERPLPDIWRPGSSSQRDPWASERPPGDSFRPKYPPSDPSKANRHLPGGQTWRPEDERRPPPSRDPRRDPPPNREFFQSHELSPPARDPRRGPLPEHERRPPTPPAHESLPNHESPSTREPLSVPEPPHDPTSVFALNHIPRPDPSFQRGDSSRHDFLLDSPNRVRVGETAERHPQSVDNGPLFLSPEFQQPLPRLPQRRPNNVKGQHKRRTRDDLGRSRFWNPGEVYVCMYLGPDKTYIGPVRLCGLSAQTISRLIDSKRDHRIEIWFQEFCTPEDYSFMCEKSRSNIRYSGGWIEGFDDTEPNIYRIGQLLRRNNILAISHPDESFPDRNVFVAISPFSSDFDFLRSGVAFSKDTFLHLIARSPLMRTESRALFEEITRPLTLSKAPESLQDRVSTEPTPIPMTEGPSKIDTQASQPAPARTQLDDQLPSNKEKFPDNVSQQATSAKGPDKKMALSDGEEPGDMNFETPVVDAAVKTSSQQLSVDNFDIDVYFRDVFRMTFDELATIGRMEKGPAEIFYLMCPSGDETIKSECAVLIEFLKKHQVLIFSNRLEEDWEKFVRTVKYGVVIFHESFVDYDRMPSLKDLMRKSFLFWTFSLRGINGTNETFFQRVFPHGCVILITEDFILREPDQTRIILAWFYDCTRRKLLGSLGSLKLMLRPNVLQWLLAQPEPKDQRKQGIWLSIYSLILQLVHKDHSPAIPDGSTYNIDPLDGIHDNFSETSVISPRHIPNYGRRSDADNIPNLPKGLTQEQRDTDHLAEFFAGWALVNSHRFRQFFIVTALKPLERWNAWNHVDVNNKNQFFETHCIDYKYYRNKLDNPNSRSSGSKGQEPSLQTTVGSPVSGAGPGAISSPTIGNQSGV